MYNLAPSHISRKRKRNPRVLREQHEHEHVQTVRRRNGVEANRRRRNYCHIDKRGVITIRLRLRRERRGLGAIAQGSFMGPCSHDTVT